MKSTNINFKYWEEFFSSLPGDRNNQLMKIAMAVKLHPHSVKRWIKFACGEKYHDTLCEEFGLTKVEILKMNKNAVKHLVNPSRKAA